MKTQAKNGLLKSKAGFVKENYMLSRKRVTCFT